MLGPSVYRDKGLDNTDKITIFSYRDTLHGSAQITPWSPTNLVDFSPYAKICQIKDLKLL